MGKDATQIAGVFYLETVVFTQTELNCGQAVCYGIDATTVNGGALSGTTMSSSIGK
jgi:hypothetical protein